MKNEITRTAFGMVLILTMAGISSIAQSPTTKSPEPMNMKLIDSADAKPCDAKPATSNRPPKPDTYETLYLTNGMQQYDLNDIQTAMRNVLPNARIYGTPAQHSITLYATQDDLALAKRILSDLDRKKNIYRLTYTLTEWDGGKKLGAQSFTLVAAAGEGSVLKQGNRMPLVTGSVDSGGSTPTSQVQYVDLGLNIDATADGNPEAVRLRTKLEQSSVADEKSGIGVQDPVIRQSRLELTTILVAGKPGVLGEIALPESGRHLEVGVLAEVIK